MFTASRLAPPISLCTSKAKGLSSSPDDGMPAKTVITSGRNPLLTCTPSVPPQEKTTSSKCGVRKICREVFVICARLVSCNGVLLYQKMEFCCYYYGKYLPKYTR